MDRGIEKFFYENYNLAVSNKKDVSKNISKELDEYQVKNDSQYYDTNIQENVTINLLEAYNGCIKEKIIKRKVYKNNMLINTYNETVCIEITPGILDNECITINYKGNIYKTNYNTVADKTNYNDIVGNLIITVNIDKKLYFKQFIENFGNNINLKYYNIYDEDYFTKSGNNIVLHKTITLKESLCGYEFTLLHLNNKIYKIESPNNTVIKPNTETIMPFHGFNRNNKKGDLIIKYNINFPETLTKEQTLLLKKLL